MSQTERQHRFLTILCFGLVYVFWGSTYLGIDIAIEHIPPALMCATRFLTAGVLLLVYCWLTGQSIRYSRRRLVQLAVIGMLLLVGGNLTLAYAELYVPTGLAALLIAVTPLWFLVLDTLPGRPSSHFEVGPRGPGPRSSGNGGSVVAAVDGFDQRSIAENSGSRSLCSAGRSAGRSVRCSPSAGMPGPLL